MTFRQWFTTHDIPYEKAVALTVGTDGLKKDKNALMSVSVTAPTVVDADIGTVYVQGASPEDVVEYTEVQTPVYKANALPILEARDRIAPVLSVADFVVVYSRGFTVPWFETEFSDLAEGCEFLDVIMMAKLVESGQMLPTDCTTVTALADRLMFATNHIRSNYSMDAVCDRIIPGISGDSADAFLTGDSPKLECAVYRLYALWSALLDMGN